MADADFASPLDAQIAFALFLTNTIIFGQLLLPILLATIVMSRTIKRHVTLSSLLLAQWLAAVASSILLFSGNISNPNPPQRLLLGAWAASQGTGIMVGVAGLLHVTHLTLATIPRFRTLAALSGVRGVLLYVLPTYMIGGTFIISVFTVGAANPSTMLVSRGMFSVRFTDPAPRIATIPLIFQCSLAIISSTVCVFTITRVVRHTRRVVEFSTMYGRESRGGFLFRLLTRYTMFCVYMGVILSVSLIGIAAGADLSRDALDVLISTFPTAAFLLFGTTSDILCTWTFWHRGPCPHPGCATFQEAMDEGRDVHDVEAKYATQDDFDDEKTMVESDLSRERTKGKTSIRSAPRPDGAP